MLTFPTIEGFTLDHSSISDDFGVIIYVRRPKATSDALQKLYDEHQHRRQGSVELSSHEKEISLMYKYGREILAALEAQTYRLDPETPKRIYRVKSDFIKVFQNADVSPIYMRQVPNEYYSDAPYAVLYPWFIVTTKIGHIKIGWRKRVINIDWTDTDNLKSGKELFPEEDTTRSGMYSGSEERRYIHAWGYDKAAEYLKVIHK